MIMGFWDCNHVAIEFFKFRVNYFEMHHRGNTFVHVLGALKLRFAIISR